MNARTHNFINTTANIKVNYPVTMATSEIPKNIPMYLRMDDDTGEPYVTDDGKYLLANGPIYAYVEKPTVEALNFQADETNEAFTTLTTQLLRTPTRNVKPCEVRL